MNDKIIYKTKNWPDLMDGIRCNIIFETGDTLIIKIVDSDIKFTGTKSNKKNLKQEN